MVLVPFLVQWNIRSFRANGHRFRSTPALNAHIICLQETFLSPTDELSFPSRTVYRADHPHARGDGLLTAVSSSIPSVRLTLPPCSDPSWEALGVKVFINNCWHIVINIYSPSGHFPVDWLSVNTSLHDPPFIILGDFNINILHEFPPYPPRLL